jgi:hypothetical protein
VGSVRFFAQFIRREEGERPSPLCARGKPAVEGSFGGAPATLLCWGTKHRVLLAVVKLERTLRLRPTGTASGCLLHRVIGRQREEVRW